MNGQNKSLPNAVRFAVCAAILVVMCAYGANAQSGGQPDKAIAKMTITGIPGDNPDGSIEAFAIDQKQTAPYHLADGSVNKATFSIMVTKGIDSASPKLSLAAAGGDHLLRVTIVWTRIDPVTKVEESSYSVILTDVVVAAIRQRPVNATDPASKDSAEYEDVTFSFSRIEWIYRLPGGRQTRHGWDLRTNRPI